MMTRTVRSLDSHETRAESIVHAEYAIVKHLLTKHDLSDLAESLAPDRVSDERFTKAGKNIMERLQAIADVRRHRLPQEHPDYQAKVVSE